MSIYYECQHFEFRVEGHEMDRVYHFIKAKSKGDAIKMPYRLRVTTSEWADLASWLSLARLVFEDADLVPYDYIHNGGCIEDARGNRSNIIGMMREVADMGRRAKMRGLSFQDLVDEFAEWGMS